MRKDHELCDKPGDHMSDSPTPDTVSSHHGAAGESVIKAGYDDRLTNQDLSLIHI